nr:SGNH/GDSL hydrolase family protein [Legionella norrlandica]
MPNQPIKISHLVVLGDSLSDKGTLNKRELLGFIPMSYLSGLSSKSPRGRFTNGFLWGDYVGATTAEQFEIEHIRKKLKLQNDAINNADISDELLSNNKEKRKNEKSFSLNEDNHILFKGTRFARFYCEGGLTAHDYSSSFTFNLALFFTRLILATLGGKRNQLLNDDKKYNISNLEKSETLVVEWSGANDLITANEKPSRAAADKAVNDRIENIELLIRNGYRNFVLFNLPDLSLTPRYQRKSREEQQNASNSTEYFNQQLRTKSLELIKKYQNLRIPINLSVFDVNEQFKKVYNNPEQYGFERDKLKSPYVESDLFKKNQQNPVDQKKHISPAKGYMFWMMFTLLQLCILG